VSTAISLPAVLLEEANEPVGFARLTTTSDIGIAHYYRFDGNIFNLRIGRSDSQCFHVEHGISDL